MTQDSYISIGDIWQAIKALDHNGAYSGISYNMTARNALKKDPPWWVFIPYGKWPADVTPNPSPLVDAILQAIRSSSTDQCFVDIIHLWGPDQKFFNEFAPVLADFVNHSTSATPVIRYLEGYLDGHPHPGESGLAHAFYDHSPPLFTNKNAHIYYGSFAPGFEPASQDQVAAVATEIWDSLITGLKKEPGVGDGLDSKLIDLKADITAWTKRFLQIASNPSLSVSIPPPSWNHAKIFAINGQTLVTGGANYWGDYATGQSWLFDLSMSITGDAAIDAHKFANYLWGYLSNIPPIDTQSFSQWNLLTGNRDGFKKAPKPPMFDHCPQNEGNIRVLSAGKIGNWPFHDPGVPEDIFNGLRDFLLNVFAVFIETKKLPSELTVLAAKWLDDDNPEFRNLLSKLHINPAGWASRYARNYAVKKAKKGIRLSQQKIVMDDLASQGAYITLIHEINSRIGSNWNGYIWPYDTLMALGYALSNISHASSPTGIQLVSSCPPPGRGYQDPVSAEVFKDKLADVMTGMHKLKYIDPNCRVLDPDGCVPEVISKYFEYKRIDNSRSEPAHGNHSKLVIVDDSVCYVGSDNAYPCYCQEFGAWIDDDASIELFLSDYWNGLWSFAKTDS